MTHVRTRCIAVSMALLASAWLATTACSPSAPDKSTVQPPAAKPLFEAKADQPQGKVESTQIRFADGTAAAGIAFRHNPHYTAEKYMPEVMGSGVAVVDLNRDGAPDVVCINAGDIQAMTRPADALNRLYINDGRGNFRDATAEWKLPSTGFGMGIAAADYDNDGWVDLLLTSFNGGETLLRNTGKAFEDVTAASAIAANDRGWSTSAGWIDVEGDGNLDLFICRYVHYTLRDALKCYTNNIHTYCTPLLYAALPDRLLHNNGNGTFSDQSKRHGMDIDPAKGLAVCVADVNGDGFDDVFVANDTTRNMLWINDGTGGLKEVARQAGVAYSEIGAEEAGMGADVTSLNGNSLLDIVCTHFQGETTAIYRQGRGSELFFREVSDAVGVGATSRARLSFGVKFFDADNDGDEDMAVANGHIEDNVATYRQDVTFGQQNTLYENIGGGQMRDVSDGAGPALQDRQVSRGLATGDLNGDGRVDFVVSNNGGTTQVAMNATEPVGHFVSLWLEGRSVNRSAIGTKVEARIGERTLRRAVLGASSYLSVSDYRIHLGLGEATKVDELTIRWPGKAAQVIKDLAADRCYHIVEGKDPAEFTPGRQVIQP